jgi:transcriptional regulator
LGVRLPLDWRSETDYAYLADLPTHDWAWELLRRSAAYRASWVRQQDAEREFEGDRRVGRDRLFQADEEIAGFGLFPPKDPDLRACDLQHGPDWRSAISVSMMQSMNLHWPGQHWPGYPKNICLSFDFTKPIEPQIEHAIWKLRRCVKIVEKTTGFRAKGPKMRLDLAHMVLYARLLDARLSDANWGEIGRVLFKGRADPRRSAKDAYQQAAKLADGGYRGLLMMANKRRAKPRPGESSGTP